MVAHTERSAQAGMHRDLVDLVMILKTKRHLGKALQIIRYS